MRDELLARRFRQKEIDADPVALTFVQSMSANLRPCNPNRGVLFESQSGGGSGARLCQLAFYRAERKTLKTMVATGRLGGHLVWSVGQSGQQGMG